MPPFPATFLSRLFLTTVSLAFLAGWGTASLNLWLSYAEADGRPGLTLDDVRARFHGRRDTNRFVAMLNGPMYKNLAEPETDAPLLTTWALEPSRSDFDPTAHRQRFQEEILPILELDCQVCHVPGGKAGKAPFRSYEEVAPLLQVDTGPDTATLARLSHFHLLGMASLILLTGLLAFAFLPTRMAGILSALAGLGLLLDVGGWWATRADGRWALLSVAGGLLFAAGLVPTHLALLQAYWFGRPGRAVPESPEQTQQR